MQHPESLDSLNSIEITQDLKDFVADVSSQIEESRGHMADWITRDDIYYRKRYGLRSKRTHPWPGAANFVMPLIDADINRVKPAYANLINVDPIVAFEPFGPEDVEPARKREILLDYRLKHKMRFLKPYLMGVDMMLEKGFTVFKIIWKFKSNKYTEFLDISELPQEVQAAIYDPMTTDTILKKIIQEEYEVDFDFEENEKEIDEAVKAFREGITKIEMTFFEKECNEPEMIVCNPKEDLTVPSDTTEIQDARWIDYRFWLSINDVKIAMRDGKYHEFRDEEIEGWAGKAKNTRSVTAQVVKEGINRTLFPDELIQLHETCVLYDIDGDGILEKCIVTWPDKDPSAILRFIELPYEHGMWPYVQVRRELTEPSFFSSRGIPALDDDFQTGISTLFNNDINNQTVVSTPYIVYRRNSVKNIRNIRYIPGQAFEVDDPSAFEIRQHVNTSQATFLNSQRLLKAWANERLGTPGSALSEQNNAEGGATGGRKTAREVELIASLHGQNQAIEMLTFQIQMADVYYQIDSLYMQFGAEEEFVMTQETPLKITRSEIRGKFNLNPNGTLDNSNPVLRSQKTVTMFQMFRGDPNIKQDELYKSLIQDVDTRLTKRLLYSAEERAMMQQQQMMQSEMLKNKMVSEQIDITRVGNMLDLEHEAGLAMIHGRQFAPEGGPKGQNGNTRNKDSK